MTRSATCTWTITHRTLRAATKIRYKVEGRNGLLTERKGSLCKIRSLDSTLTLILIGWAWPRSDAALVCDLSVVAGLTVTVPVVVLLVGHHVVTDLIQVRLLYTHLLQLSRSLLRLRHELDRGRQRIHKVCNGAWLLDVIQHSHDQMITVYICNSTTQVRCELKKDSNWQAARNWTFIGCFHDTTYQHYSCVAKGTETSHRYSPGRVSFLMVSLLWLQTSACSICIYGCIIDYISF